MPRRQGTASCRTPRPDSARQPPPAVHYLPRVRPSSEDRRFAAKVEDIGDADLETAPDLEWLLYWQEPLDPKLPSREPADREGATAVYSRNLMLEMVQLCEKSMKALEALDCR